jgi:SAM-dependent methyltransferase
MLNIARRLMRSIRSEGALGAMRRSRYHCYEQYREWSLGIRTAELLDPYGPAGDSMRRPYEPLCYACIDAAFARVAPQRDDVLLDYGCGRGRITAVAATHPFRKVIGIELHEELCASARVNMHRLRGKQCSEWEILQEDASEYRVPDDVNVVFLFNPFLGHVLDCVVHRLYESVASRRRVLKLIYMNPESDRDVFESCGWLNCKAELPVGLWRGMRFRLYESGFQPHTQRKESCDAMLHQTGLDGRAAAGGAIDARMCQ